MDISKKANVLPEGILRIGLEKIFEEILEWIPRRIPRELLEKLLAITLINPIRLPEIFIEETKTEIKNETQKYKLVLLNILK